MKIAIGSDHGGFKLKEEVKEYLAKEGYEVIDCGTDSEQSCHYPMFGLKAANEVKSKEADRGIVICTSGEGIMIAANKVKGIRCGLAYNEDVARLMVEHNNCNMIALGANYTTIEEACKRIDIFLNAKFLGDRHALRVKMITDYEDEHES